MCYSTGSSFNNENQPEPSPSHNQQFSLVNKDLGAPPLKDETEDNVCNNLLRLLQDANRNNHYSQFLPARYLVNMGHAIPQPAGTKHPELLPSSSDRAIEGGPSHPDARFAAEATEGYPMVDSGNDEGSFLGKRRPSVFKFNSGEL